MKILDQIITILTPLVPVLLILFNNKLAGLKVKILAILTAVISAWTFASDTLLPQMCSELHLFCNVQDTHLFASMGMVAAFLAYVIRQVQGGSAKLSELPDRIIGKKTS